MYQNQLRFARVIDKSLLLHFYAPRCIAVSNSTQRKRNDENPLIHINKDYTVSTVTLKIRTNKLIRTFMFSQHTNY